MTRLRLILLALVLAVLVGCPDPLDGGGEPTGPGSENPPSMGTLVLVPAGSFQRDATPANITTISEPFRMTATEITRAQFLAVMEHDPSIPATSTGVYDPVQMVNWFHAITFCNKLSLREGLTPVYAVTGVNFATIAFADVPTFHPDPASHSAWNAVTVNWSADGYRLPTTMERMWAAMGADSGSPGALNASGYTKAFAGSTGINSIHDYAWFAEDTTHPVGTKLPNELGLYDMSGNAEEWCWDWYEATYPAGALDDATYRDRERQDAAYRVLRGGGRDEAAEIERQAVSYFDYWEPWVQTSYLGFRVVRR